MPRRSRLMLPKIPVHIIQRGNNRQVCFVAEDDYRYYLGWLKEYAKKSKCHIHAYVLMTNHVHLLLTGDNVDSVSQLMKGLGQRYVQYFNRAYGRSGTLWDGRFRSCLIQDELYMLNCMRYIELNPLRAGMVAHPREYPWSSYCANAEGKDSQLVEPHELYLSLGQDNLSRQNAYKELFGQPMDVDFVEQIRQSTNGNIVLGNSQFSEEIAKILGKRVTRGKSGRPKKLNL
jgi:putative transposase